MKIQRLIEPHFRRLLGQYPVLTLTGPRQSGKTYLSRMVVPDWKYVSLEDLDSRRFAMEDPKGFLRQYRDGAILDEIQRAPDLPSYIQGIVDEDGKPGQFVLTGSQQFEVTRSISQSLAGRTAVLRLLPFAYGEIYEPGPERPELRDLLYKGFYPRIHDQGLNPTEALSFYVSTYLERDLQSFIHVRDLGAFERFLRVCAAHVGQTVNMSKLGADIGVDQKTAQSWLSILEASYIVYFLQPHFRNFRKRLVKSPKLYFCDVGLAAFLLGIASPDHVDSHPLKGALFENFVVLEFLKSRYNQALPGNLYFFRDRAGMEVDLILDEGKETDAVEIKMGSTVQPEHFKGLLSYQKMARGTNRRRALIYGGDQAREQSGVEVLPYDRMDARNQAP